MLEPCEAKVSRTVLRGEGARKGSDLPGPKYIMDYISKTCGKSFLIACAISTIFVVFGSGLALHRFIPPEQTEQSDASQAFSVFGVLLLVIVAFMISRTLRPYAIRIASFCFVAALAFMPALHVCLSFMCSDLPEAARHIVYASGLLSTCVFVATIGLSIAKLNERKTKKANTNVDHISGSR